MDPTDLTNIAKTKTFIFNVAMLVISLTGLTQLNLTPEQLQALAGALATLWCLGAIIIRRFTSRPVVIGPLPKGTVQIIVAGFLCGALLAFGGCSVAGLTTAGGPQLSTDARLAQVEAALAAGNAAAQAAFEAGLVDEKYRPKVQAGLDAAQLALAEAKKALADGKLDASDAVQIALDAAFQVPAIVARFKAAK